MANMSNAEIFEFLNKVGRSWGEKMEHRTADGRETRKTLIRKNLEYLRLVQGWKNGTVDGVKFEVAARKIVLTMLLEYVRFLREQIEDMEAAYENAGDLEVLKSLEQEAEAKEEEGAETSTASN